MLFRITRCRTHLRHHLRRPRSSYRCITSSPTWRPRIPRRWALKFSKRRAMPFADIPHNWKDCLMNSLFIPLWQHETNFYKIRPWLYLQMGFFAGVPGSDCYPAIIKCRKDDMIVIMEDNIQHISMHMNNLTFLM